MCGSQPAALYRGILTVDLSLLGGGSGSYNYLAAGNTIIPVGQNANGARWGNFLSITNVNISGANITQMASVNVPTGELIVIKALQMADLTVTPATLEFQLEVDGVVVINYSGVANTLDRIGMVGNDIGLANPNSNEIITDIEVRSNFRVLAKKTPAIAADLTVTYAKIRRG